MRGDQSRSKFRNLVFVHILLAFYLFHFISFHSIPVHFYLSRLDSMLSCSVVLCCVVWLGIRLELQVIADVIAVASVLLALLIRCLPDP